MSVRKIIALLSIALASASCKKNEVKAEAKDESRPVTCEPQEKAVTECRRSLDACVTKTAWLESRPADPQGDVPAEAAEFTIRIGATYVLGQGNQTIVMNAKPVDDGMRRFPTGATCRFDPEGLVKIIAAHDAKSDDGAIERDYLVRYTREPEPEALKDGALERPDSEPYECPTGTVFFLDDTSILEEREPDTRFEDARKLLDSEKH